MALNPAWTRRREAARKYRPNRIRLLLVAEAPPADPDRYLYFETPKSVDPLFEEVTGVLFEASPPEKTAALKELRRRGVFLVELKPDGPREDAESLVPYVPPLLINLETLAPEKIVLVGADAYRAAFPLMEKAGLPVVDVKVPSPAEGAEIEFRQSFRQALVRAGHEKLIRPLPSRG